MEKLIFLLKVSILNIVVSQRIPFFFVLEQTSSFPLLRFDWQVEQINFVFSVLAVVVIHASSKVSEHLGHMFASQFLTDDQSINNHSKYIHIQDHTRCYREKFK